MFGRKARMEARWDRLDRRLDGLTRGIARLSTRMARVLASLDLMTGERTRAEQRMADRLIEMTMVNRGLAQQASVHRNIVRLDKPDLSEDAGEDLWTNEDEWPPPGHDAMNLP